MIAAEKPVLVIVGQAEYERVREPYALECARTWAGVTGISLIAAVGLSFAPESWARAWGAAAGIVGGFSVWAVVSLFRDYVNGVRLLPEGDEDDF